MLLPIAYSVRQALPMLVLKTIRNTFKEAGISMYRSAITFCLTLLLVANSISNSPAQENNAVPESQATWVTSITRLGDSSSFAAGTADGLLLRDAKVYKFDAEKPNEMTPLYSHPAAVWQVVSTRDGSKIASVDYRGNLVVFETTAKPVATKGGPWEAGPDAKHTMHEKAFERWCQAMIISPDDNSLIAGTESGKIMVWDLKAGKVSKTAELEGHAVTGLSWAPNGTQLAASDGGGHVHLFTWPALEPQGKIKVSDETAWCVAYTSQGKLLVGSSDRNLYEAEPKPEATVKSVAKGSDWITQIAISSSGQVAASEVGGKLHFPSLGGTDSMKASSGVWTLCWNGNEQLFAGTRKDGIMMAGRSWKWTEPAPEVKDEPKAEEEPKEEMKKEEAKPEEKTKKPEPAKPVPAKPVPAKPVPAKPVPAKPVPAKPEPAKPEPAKPEPAKPEPAKPDTGEKKNE